MPVTAKLSRRFYDQFGDETANELVEWLNSVDAAYRSDLREMNELNFSRFDAKLETRFATFETRMAMFETRITRWMFAFCLFGALVAQASLLYVLLRPR